MTALLRIARVGRGEAGWLTAGAVVSLLAVGVLLALSVGTAGRALEPGAAVALAIAGPAVLRMLGLGRVVIRYAERMVTHMATFRVLTALRLWLFRGMAARSAGGLGFMRAGDALSRLVGDVEALDGLYLRVALPALAALVLAPVLVGLLWLNEPWVALIVGVLFAISALGLPWWAARRTQADGGRLAEAGSGLRVAVLDVVAGLREVLAYGASARMLAAVQAHEAGLVAVQHDIASRGAAAQALAGLCGQAALLAVVLGGGPLLVPALFLTLAAFEVVGGMPRAGVQGGVAAAAARRVVAAAEAPARVAEPDAPLPVPAGTGIVFEDVVFRWQPDRPPVLAGLRLEIAAGSRVAILGPSGAGKSTLCALMLKVAVPEAGRVLLGGTDLARLPAAAVQARMAWLGQATHVFQDSVRANLLLGRPDADDAALWRALDAAQLADKVRGLPRGLDTWIDNTLSGGEGRRLALARALLSPAPILVLDEPAAGLDAATEAAFFRTLNDTAEGRTVVLIVHRLTGVERVDRVWRLSAGRAVAATG